VLRALAQQKECRVEVCSEEMLVNEAVIDVAIGVVAQGN
jgi:hypothetical protein